MEQAEVIRDPEIPYVGAVGGRFTPGKTIRIQGAVPGIAYKFDVNLQCGPQTVPRDDIALQISVRILDGFIAMNTLQAGVWGEELRGLTQPIKRAHHFEMIIMCDFNKYKIAINGQPFHDFPQRMHYDCITHLTIDGDVTINEILYGPSETFATSIPVIATPRQANNDFEFINPPRSNGVDSQPPYNEVVENYPTNGQPYPMKVSPRSSPYPSGIPGAPYPTSSSSYPATSAPSITLPINTPLSPNAASHNFTMLQIQKLNTSKYGGFFWGASLVVILFLTMVFLIVYT